MYKVLDVWVLWAWTTVWSGHADIFIKRMLIRSNRDGSGVLIAEGRAARTQTLPDRDRRRDADEAAAATPAQMSNPRN